MHATIQTPRPALAARNQPGLGDVPGVGYCGPDRRRQPQPSARWLAMMLEEVDHGMLLLDADARVLHANHLACAELDAPHPLRMAGGRLHARSGRDALALQAALHAAVRGLRRLLALGDGPARTSVAVVPVTGDGDAPLALVSLGKRQLSQRLTLECFARCHSLTGAETRVLELLCAGIEPLRIAALNGVEVCTVRTQISCIRQKTGVADITALLMRVAQLPPMVSALRTPPGGADGDDQGQRLRA